MYFRNHRIRKKSLHKCLKGPVSEDSSTDNMANGLKDCWNLTNSTFTIFVNHCGGICVGKILF